MNFNLRILNLWIGLCRGVPGLPRDFYTLRYQDGYIERKIKNQDNEDCVPELIISSEAQEHSILFEWKAGANTVNDQLRRYSRRTPTELQRLAGLSVRATKSFDVAIIGKSEHAGRLRIGIQAGGYRFPLLLVDETGIHRDLNEFANPRLNSIFAPTLALDFSRAPINFVPIDSESASWEVAEIVMPQILQVMHRRDTSVTCEVLCSAICPLWSAMEKAAKEAVRSKVCEVLQQASDGEFSEYLEWKKTQQSCTVEIISNPISFKSDRRSAAFKKIQRAAIEFRLRLISGRKLEHQLPLFE